MEKCNYRRNSEISISDLRAMGLPNSWVTFARHHGVKLLILVWEKLAEMDKKEWGLEGLYIPNINLLKRYQRKLKWMYTNEEIH